ncbi:BTAD domain-containing putative transcriptional regulator [Streptomyces sp. NPDC058700]|uniref:BTAD domain-containing putative transcriptional regulator n=1 Tax=Streptomyces sp. NPDC058700 TaxID=3346607 RepID=UPI00365C58CB
MGENIVLSQPVLPPKPVAAPPARGLAHAAAPPGRAPGGPARPPRIRPPVMTERGVSFRLLGPLEIATANGRLPLKGMNQRLVLALLLLHANHVVPTTDLMDVLWPDGRPPATGRKSLQNTISALRGVLARGGVPEHIASLTSEGSGYMLKTAPENLDLTRFRLLADKGRDALAAGDTEEAARLLRGALGLWRGRALAELAEAGLDWPQTTAADGARLHALEEYCEAELANGRPHEVIRRLEGVAAADPSRERTQRLLMTALYRSSRRDDALRAYERLHQQLRDDLGAAPSRELQDLHGAIVRQDPLLTPGGTPAPRGSGPRPSADPELDLLHALLDLVRRQNRPHVVALTGDAEERQAALVARLMSGLEQDDRAAVWHVQPGPEGADLAHDLRAALRRATPERPMVAVAEHLHQAGHLVPECVGDIVTEAGRTPLLIVLTARTGSHGLWPGWDKAVPRFTTITV